MKIYRRLLLGLLVILAACPAFASEYVPGDVLVVLKPSNPAARVSASSLSETGSDSVRAASFAASSGAYVKKVFPALSETGNSIYALLHSEAKSPEELTTELLSNPEVLAASPNYKVRAAVVPNDSYMEQSWGLNYINAPSAWDVTTGSKTVYAAVIDTGIDYTNPDLAGNFSTEYSAYVQDFGSTKDDNGHGSHVAGIIGAVGNNGVGIAGVCWNVGLISVKVLDRRGEGSIADVMGGVDYVTKLIKDGVNVRAVNLSLEVYLPTAPTHDNLISMPLWRSFKDLDTLNHAVIVVAAGNHATAVGQPTTRTEISGTQVIFTPGEYVYPPSFQGLDNMISVSAIDSSGSLAYFSNTNADISAPGVNIISTWLQSSTAQANSVTLKSEDGTSMAAPYISGAIALLSSAAPDRTAYQLKQALLNGSEVSAASTQVRASASGILDIRAALDYLSANYNLPSSSTEWTEYNDYAEQTVDENYDYTNGDSSSGGSSGCSAAGMGILAVGLVMLLALRKHGKA